MQFPVVVSGSSGGGNEPPKIYGQVLGEPVDSSLTKVFSFSFASSKVPLGNATPQTSYLTVLFGARVKPPGTDEPAPTDPVLPPTPMFNLRFQVTHLEHNIQPPNAAGYQASSWLTILIPATLPKGGKSLQTAVPIPLRQFPTAPVITNVKAKPGDPADCSTSVDASIQPSTIKDAKHWFYSFQFEHRYEPRDEVVVEVEYNTAVAARAAVSDTLAAALVRFRRKYPFVRQQLATDPKAVDWLLTLVGDIANADWTALATLRNLGPDFYTISTDLPVGSCTVDMKFQGEGDPHAAHIRVCPRETTPVKPIITDRSPTEYSVRYQWPKHEPRPELIRELRFGLDDVTENENAWGGAALLRNGNLLTTVPSPKALEVREEFRYRTPVRFGARMTPFILVTDPLIFPSVTPGTQLKIVDHLDSFFKEVLSNLKRSYLIRLRTMYKFDIGPKPAVAELIVSTPISFWPNQVINEQNRSQVISAIADDLTNWCNQHHCSPKGMFVLDFAVFGASAGDGLPVLHLLDCRLPLVSIKM